MGFDEPRSTADAVFQDMLWENTSTIYEQQNRYDSQGNYWHMAGFHGEFYQSAEEYSSEGLILVQTNSSIVAIWAITESWALTNDTAKLEEDSIQSLDMTGIEHVKIIDYSVPRGEYNRNIVLFTRDEMPLEGMTNETLDTWVKVMTDEMDHLKSQYYLAPEFDNAWFWDDGYENVLDAPEVELDDNRLTLRAVRDNPSIPEYPMWVEEPDPVVRKPVIEYGNVTLEGWDLDNSWGYDSNGTLTTPIEGRSCTPTQDGVPEGNCPLERDQNIFLLKNSGNETVNVDGWKIVWYEDIDPIGHDDFRRNIVTIDNLAIPANNQVEYEYQYPYGPDYVSPEGGLYLYDASGVLVDQFGPGFYQELTVVDQQFKDSWVKTESYPTVFVDPNEFLGLRLL